MACRIPRDLFDLVLMTTPDLFRTVRLVDAPQINVLAYSGHRQTAAVLPLNFEPFKGRVQLRVVEANNVFALNDVPDGDLARVAARGDEICSAFIEL